MKMRSNLPWVVTDLSGDDFPVLVEELFVVFAVVEPNKGTERTVSF
jgi:hypothetical protein